MSVVTRWRRRIRRHPVAATLVTLALLTAGIMGAIAWHTRATAAEQAALARRFGREVERIDLQMRLSHLAALHDVRREKAALRASLDRWEAALPTLGPGARSVAHFALGRGYASLGELRPAREHLERARRDDPRDPEVARALAQVLGSLYQEGLVDAERLPDGAARDARRQELERRYRDRARDLLRSLPEGGAGLLEARLALDEGRFDEAIRLAGEVARATPWRYEAALLEGDAIVAAVAADRGRAAPEAMIERLGAAGEAFRRAAEQGRSDPRVHERLCSLGGSIAGLEFFDTGGDLGPTVTEAERACRDSMAADPDRGRPHALLAGLLTLRSRDLSRRGEDPMATIERAISEGRAAVRLGPDEAEHARRLGVAFAYQAQFERERGRDSRVSVTEAVAALGRAIDLDPGDAASYNALGLARWEQILVARNHGEDQEPYLDAATAAFRKATELVPDDAKAFSNLGSIYNLRVEHEAAHGLDQAASLEAAAKAFRRAIDADPGFTYAYNNLGNVFRHRAEVAMEEGRSPEAEVEEASRYYRLAAEKNRSWSYPRFNQGLALFELAQWQVDTGRDPEAAIDGAAEAFRGGLELQPDLPQALRSAAMIEVLRARHAVEDGGDPRPGLAAARDLLRRADAVDPESGFGLELLGAVEMLTARSGQGDADAHLRAAEAALERATEVVPDGAEAYQLLAELYWHEAVLARKGARERGRPAAVRQAVDAGLVAAARALELNKLAADAEVWRAELELLAAEAGLDPDAARAAREAFDHAFESKPSLAHRHGDARRRARALTDRPAGESAVEVAAARRHSETE